jgi:hypothetical protein
MNCAIACYHVLIEILRLVMEMDYEFFFFFFLCVHISVSHDTSKSLQPSLYFLRKEHGIEFGVLEIAFYRLIVEIINL